MVTLKELAEICNVSVSTVSMVLNGKSKASQKTKEHILETAQRMGYQPNLLAQSLRNARTKTITLIVDDIAQFTSGPMVESIMQYCEEKGYRVTMYNLRLYSRWTDSWQEQTEAFKGFVRPVLQEVKASRADGVIYVAGHNRVVTCFREDFSIPVVMAHAVSDRKDIPAFVLDDLTSEYELVRYLLEHGHRKIGFIGGRLDNIHAQLRLQGYQKALEEYGIEFDPALSYYGEWIRETGYQGAKELLEKGVTAFCCTADKIAGGVYDYLETTGLKVGEDISVTGFDDELIASYFTPKLTTTAMPLYQIGHSAAETLIAILEAEDPYAETVKRAGVHEIPCCFTERKSVGYCKENG